MEVGEFINWLYPFAERAGEVSPVFSVAQAALETGWGSKCIGNNLFGVTKGSQWAGKTLLVTTTEYFHTPDRKFVPPEEVLYVHYYSNGLYRYKVKRLFRDYDTLTDCFRDHNDLLCRVYPDAWPFRNDPEKFVEHLQDRIGLRYATSEEYVSTMKKMFTIVRRNIVK